MELLKKIFGNDERVVGLCPFERSFVRKQVFVAQEDFPKNKIVYSADIARNPNIFAFAK